LDNHASGDKVAKAGLELALKLSAKSALLHVHPLEQELDAAHFTYTDYGINDMNLEIDWDSIMKRQSISFLKEVQKKLKANNSELMVKSGDVAITIIETALHWHADLIVIGSHSRRIFEDIFLGNTAVKVVKRSPIPILIIPVKENKKQV